MTSCDEIRISLGALAVSALDAEEELAIREHVAGCPRCAAELAELVETVGVLAAAKPVLLPAKVPPDPRVLDGLLGAVAARLGRRRGPRCRPVRQGLGYRGARRRGRRAARRDLQPGRCQP